MVSETNKIQPIVESISQRIHGYDVARSLAIFGMVIVNYSSFMGGWGVGPSWLVWLVELLPGRAAAMFAVLAGVGMSLMARQSRDSNNPSEKLMVRNRLLKRAAFLLIAGLAHYYLLWSADILHYYGIYLAVGAFLLFAPAKKLWSIAGLLILVFFLMFLFTDYEVGWDFETMHYADFWTPVGFFRHLFFNGYHPIFPWLAFLLAGIWLGQQDLHDRTRRRRFILASAAVAIVTELLSWLSMHYLSNGAAWHSMEEITVFFGRESMPPLPLYMLQAGSTAICIISLSVAVAERFTRTFWLRPFVLTGQMALTLYLTHIIVGIGIIESFSTLQNRTLVFSCIASLGFFIVAMTFSCFWRRRFARGPFEWVMRKLTS